MTRRSREILVRSGPNIPWAPAGVPVTPGTEYDRTLNSQLVPSDVLIAEFQSGTSQSYSKSIQSAIGNVADTLVRTTSQAHQHFEDQVQDAAVEVAEGMRSDDFVTSWGGNEATSYWSYDVSVDAMRMRFEEGQNNSLSGPQQIIRDFNAISEGNGDTSICLQYDMMWDIAWQYHKNVLMDPTVYGANSHWNGTYKLVRLDCNYATEERWMEIPQSGCGNDIDTTSGTFCAIPRIRPYGGVSNEPDYESGPSALTIRPGGVVNLQDQQPGGFTADVRSERPFNGADHLTEGKPWFIMPNVWNRVTWWMVFSGPDDHHMTQWMADENNDPVKIIDSISSVDTGFEYHRSISSESGSDSVRFELNTSSPVPLLSGAPDLRIWFRNLLIFRSKQIPLGGRPIP